MWDIYPGFVFNIPGCWVVGKTMYCMLQHKVALDASGLTTISDYRNIVAPEAVSTSRVACDLIVIIVNTTVFVRCRCRSVITNSNQAGEVQQQAESGRQTSSCLSQTCTHLQQRCLLMFQTVIIIIIYSNSSVPYKR